MPSIIAPTGSAAAGRPPRPEPCLRSRLARLVTSLVLISTAAVGTAAPARAAGLGNQLDPGHRLAAGDWLSSPNGVYQLIMQDDGNLVERGPQGEIWASHTAGSRAYLDNQADGNIVIYGREWTWATDTAGRGAARLEIQDDGNVVAYATGREVTWTTYTSGGANKLQATGAVAYARRQLGKPYAFGASGPDRYTAPVSPGGPTRKSASSSNARAPTSTATGQASTAPTCSRAIWCSTTAFQPMPAPAVWPSTSVPV